MLSPEQEQRLTQGGDCPDHYHSTDRLKVHSDIASLQALANVNTPASGSYSVGLADDFILANNAGPFALPKSKNDGREIEIVMTGTATVTINLATGDYFFGESSILLEDTGTAMRLRAISGGWMAI